MPQTEHNFAIRRFQCRHIFHDGHRCGSPCLKGEEFCFYHYATHRAKRAALATPRHDSYNEPPNQTSFTLPIPEDHSSIQLAIATVMNQLALNALDPRRAGLLLYALQIASGNLGTKPQHKVDNLVHDVTLDPVEGPLAPKNELPEDAKDRQYLQDLRDLAKYDDDDDDDEEDDDEDGPENEDQYQGTIPAPTPAPDPKAAETKQVARDLLRACENLGLVEDKFTVQAMPAPAFQGQAPNHRPDSPKLPLCTLV